MAAPPPRIKHSRAVQLSVTGLRDDVLSVFSKANEDNEAHFKGGSEQLSDYRCRTIVQRVAMIFHLNLILKTNSTYVFWLYVLL